MPGPKKGATLNRYTVMTQAEVGSVMGISAMRVCQIEKRALAKLRREFLAHGSVPGFSARQLDHLARCSP